MTTDDQLREYPFEAFRGELPAEVIQMVVDDPVSRVRLPDGRAAWLVLGYDEVCTVLADQRFTRFVEQPDDARCPADTHDQPRELGMNGSAHTTLRRLAARAFTARRIEAYRGRVQEITDELLDAMVVSGQPADLVGALIAPLPALVICEVLGVPTHDRERFNGWATSLLSLTAYGSPEAAATSTELRAYLAERLVSKRRAPGDDLLSAWAAGQGDDELTDEEIIGLAVGVLIGGREINSTSAGLRALFLHPEQLATLRAEPDRLPSAVEEILRYTAVSSMFLVQTAVADVELGGVTIRAGDSVMAVPWAANRHPTVFTDADIFDIGRVNNPHLAFGYGPHFCLGAALGRLEVEVALGTLLRRFPHLAPAVPIDQLPWRHDRINCGIAEFPVIW